MVTAGIFRRTDPAGQARAAARALIEHAGQPAAAPVPPGAG
jgi:hypothetical protein